MDHATPLLQIELSSDARQTNNRYCAIAPLDRQTYNAGYHDIHLEIEAPRPGAPINDPDLRCWGLVAPLARPGVPAAVDELRSAGCVATYATSGWHGLQPDRPSRSAVRPDCSHMLLKLHNSCVVDSYLCQCCNEIASSGFMGWSLVESSGLNYKF
jgi:hypothetical protein